jgi:hypothetical protein
MNIYNDNSVDTITSTMMPNYHPRHKITKDALFSKDFLTFSAKYCYFFVPNAARKLLPTNHTVAFFPRFQTTSQTAVHFHGSLR